MGVWYVKFATANVVILKMQDAEGVKHQLII